jgi:hypothetical protein
MSPYIATHLFATEGATGRLVQYRMCTGTMGQHERVGDSGLRQRLSVLRTRSRFARTRHLLIFDASACSQNGDFAT